jgi:hypothetical protein
VVVAIENGKCDHEYKNFKRSLPLYQQPESEHVNKEGKRGGNGNGNRFLMIQQVEGKVQLKRKIKAKRPLCGRKRAK